MLVHLLQMQVCVSARTCGLCRARLSLLQPICIFVSRAVATRLQSFSKIFRGVKHLNYTDDGGRALR